MGNHMQFGQESHRKWRFFAVQPLILYGYKSQCKVSVLVSGANIYENTQYQHQLFKQRVGLLSISLLGIQAEQGGVNKIPLHQKKNNNPSSESKKCTGVRCQ